MYRTYQHSDDHLTLHEFPADVRRRVFFGLMFALSVAEMCFTVDSFQYLQKKNKWWSGTERARMAFLIFSAARTILLSAVYIGFHCAVKHMHNMLHTVSLRGTPLRLPHTHADFWADLSRRFDHSVDRLWCPYTPDVGVRRVRERRHRKRL